jgi:hypothetical protein
MGKSGIFFFKEANELGLTFANRQKINANFMYKFALYPDGDSNPHSKRGHNKILFKLRL